MLEVIGEACGKISDEVKKRHSEILWGDISGMRNKIVHEYFGVNLKLVWKTITDDLPVLKAQIVKIKDELIGEEAN